MVTVKDGVLELALNFRRASEYPGINPLTGAIVEFFIVDFHAGRIIMDLDTEYPVPERILKPNPEVAFSLFPGPGHIEYDSYAEDPTAVVLINARGHRVTHTSRYREFRQELDSIHGD